ncbi:related to ROT1 - molecular chaperone in the endoplasmic reticulum [Ustilago trichophora]|uniref:Related to ROT1 - molecular chaperone in the endoplasmic reticulum n=1 Tax=Ustilago trichophora TaxID=86804 RepID=A0A5C3E850_9BASI|nr:related to ROT1 - molecular chaperone in the endoplasmic reticulum [Ustilago trichophora]
MMSRLITTLSVALAVASLALPTVVNAQEFTFQNVTSIMGTWSSGSQNVTTGLDFFNPVTQEFKLPATAGISYSFTDDGFFEEARYQFTSNAVTNRCFKASLIWQHGTYQFHTNGSITLTPFPADGYVQVLDPCGAQTSSIYHYSEFELISSWYNFQDNHPGFKPAGTSAYALQLQSFDGSKLPQMWLRNRPPNMLPTKQLFQQVLNDAGA